MKIPTIVGIIRRRILLNYRIDPEVIQPLLPSVFQPKLVSGKAIAGICLIRLEEIRPRGLPRWVGIASENSAHRIAVEWNDENGAARNGVFVPRRDTDSRLNALAGGRVFPGEHHLSSFRVEDGAGRISIQVTDREAVRPLVDLQVSETDDWSTNSVFGSLGESSSFFESGCIGYSPRLNSCGMDGLLLKVDAWQVSPLVIDSARSSYFDDESIFPAGSIELDHGLLMRDIRHEWHSEPEMAG